MFTNDKKALIKAFYVCLTVSSAALSSEGYGMYSKDDYILTPSGKRVLQRNSDGSQAKKLKNNQGQSRANAEEEKARKEAERLRKQAEYDEIVNKAHDSQDVFTN